VLAFANLPLLPVTWFVPKVVCESVHKMVRSQNSAFPKWCVPKMVQNVAALAQHNWSCDLCASMHLHVLLVAFQVSSAGSAGSNDMHLAVSSMQWLGGMNTPAQYWKGETQQLVGPIMDREVLAPEGSCGQAVRGRSCVVHKKGSHVFDVMHGVGLGEVVGQIQGT